MPVINDGVWYSVDELFTGRSGVPFDSNFQREYTRRFRVVVMDQTMSSIAVCGAPGLPQPWETYQSGIGTEYDLYAVCTRLSAEQESDDDWQNWIVTAAYSTQVPGGGLPSDAGSFGQPSSGSGSQNQPELEPVDLDWDSEEKDEALPCDRNNKAFVNSAGQPFTPPPTLPVSYPILTFSKNFRTWSADDQLKCSYVTNSVEVWGRGIKTLLMLPPKPKYVSKGTLKYWKVTFRIKFAARKDKDGNVVAWSPYEILDRGTKEYHVTTDTLEPIYDSHGNAVTSPVLLDGNGLQQVARDGDGLLIPAYQQFIVYDQASFSYLLGADLITEIGKIIGA